MYKLNCFKKVNLTELKDDFDQMKNDSNMLITSGKKIKKNENDVKSEQQVKKKKLTRKEKVRLEKVI